MEMGVYFNATSVCRKCSLAVLKVQHPSGPQEQKVLGKSEVNNSDVLLLQMFWLRENKANG